VYGKVQKDEKYVCVWTSDANVFISFIMFVLGAKNNACVRLHLSRLTMKEFLLFMPSGDVDVNALLSQTRKIFLPLSVFEQRNLCSRPPVVVL